MNRTKIICTIGPASNSEEKIEALIHAGMNVARLNFSHGTHEDHLAVAKKIRKVSEKLRKPVAILQDLQGPKIRSGLMENGGIELVEGNEVVVTTQDIQGTAARFSTTYASLAQDLSEGDKILLDDGKLRLRTLRIDGDDVVCEIERGGILRDRKGMNLPGVQVSEPSLTEKDLVDLKFGMELSVDAVALSFVRSPRDVRLLRRELVNAKNRPVVIAKLEKPEVLEQFEGILDEADGIMVARGDLGVEVPAETVPILQKEWVKRANSRGKLSIVATQMLESMLQNDRPTRAEASDVANAVLDGADLVMLSGETATGDFPIEAASMMQRIICDIERSSRHLYENIAKRLDLFSSQAHQNALAPAAVRSAKDGKIKRLLFTQRQGPLHVWWLNIGPPCRSLLCTGLQKPAFFRF